VKAAHHARAGMLGPSRNSGSIGSAQQAGEDRNSNNNSFNAQGTSI